MSCATFVRENEKLRKLCKTGEGGIPRDRVEIALRHVSLQVDLSSWERKNRKKLVLYCRILWLPNHLRPELFYQGGAVITRSIFSKILTKYSP